MYWTLDIRLFHVTHVACDFGTKWTSTKLDSPDLDLTFSIFKDIEMGLESGLGILAGQLWGHATQRFNANHSLLMSPLRPLRSQNISIDVVRFLGNYQTRSNSNGFSWKKSKYVF